MSTCISNSTQDTCSDIIFDNIFTGNKIEQVPSSIVRILRFDFLIVNYTTSQDGVRSITIDKESLLREIASSTPMLIYTEGEGLDINDRHFRLLKRDHNGQLSLSLMNLPFGGQKYRSKKKN